MSKKKNNGGESTAVAGSASITDSPALRLSLQSQDEIEKRADSFTGSPVAQANADSEPKEPKQKTENSGD